MLIYKQRYKPRTTREFTKSDLTVYDSAGNTALNALTVYGKSEVVNNAILSAGEGWATVDLGTLTWYAYSQYPNRFAARINTGKYSNNQIIPALCANYTFENRDWTQLQNHEFNYGQQIVASNVACICIYDTDYTDPEDFKTAMSGILLCYQLADPTQGNTIAVKTDDGSDINGTMAVFSTGTPLRGIPDSDIRDVMQWDGSSGEVTKVCAKINASSLSWGWNATYNFWTTTSLQNIIKPSNRNAIQSFILTVLNYTPNTWADFGNINNTYAITIDGTLGIKDDNNYPSTTPPDFDIIYELATPTTEQLTSTENTSIAGLRTFEPQTHSQNNAQTDMTVDYTIKVPTI